MRKKQKNLTNVINSLTPNAYTENSALYYTVKHALGKLTAHELSCLYAFILGSRKFSKVLKGKI